MTERAHRPPHSAPVADAPATPASVRWARWLIRNHGVVGADGQVRVPLSQDAAASSYGRSAGTIAGYVAALEASGWLVSRSPLRFTNPDGPVPAALGRAVPRSSSLPGEEQVGVAGDRDGPARGSLELVALLLRRHRDDPRVVAALADVVEALADDPLAPVPRDPRDLARGSATGASADRDRSGRQDRTDLTDGCADADPGPSVRSADRDREPASGAEARAVRGEDAAGRDGPAAPVGEWVARVIDVAVTHGANPHYPGGLFERLVARFGPGPVGAGVNRVIDQVRSGSVHSPFRVLAAAADDPARALEYFRDPAPPVADPAVATPAPGEVDWVPVVDADGTFRLARPD